MPTQEDRIAALEQTTVSRIEFIDAMNRLILQQAQNASNTSHEITILLGVVSSQGQDIRTIKEDVKGITERLQHLETKVDDHSRILNDHSRILNDHSRILNDHSKTLDDHSRILNDHTTRFDRLETLLTQVLAHLPEKP